MLTQKGSLVKNWIPEELAWIGFIVTAAVGGVVGYIKNYEQAVVEHPWRVRLWGISRRVLMAAFAGWIVYQFTLIYAISDAWGHVLSGIIGMFAAEFFEVLWVLVRGRVTAMIGERKDGK